jgi:hypothetical protein
MRRSARTLLVVLVTLLVVGSTALGPGLAAAQDDDEDGPGPADEAFVTEDGDVVLLYENDSSTQDGNAEYGVDVGENLAYGLFEVPIDQPIDATGNLSMVVTDERFTANTTASMPRPPLLQNLDMTVDGRTTAENNSFDASLDTSYRMPGQSTGGPQYESASTTGTVTTTPSHMTLDGEFEGTFTEAIENETHVSMSVTESDGGYELAVDVERTLSANETANWSSRGAARETITEQFGTENLSADDGGGDVSTETNVVLEEYSFTEQDDGTADLDARYTVEYVGLEDAIVEAFAAEMANDTQMSLSEAEAQDLADRMGNLQVETLEFTLDAEGRSMDWSISADVRNYDEVLLGFVEMAEATETSTTADLERTRKALEAREAADLQSRLTWEGSFSRTEMGQQLSGDVRSRTTNWQDYVSELQDRDVNLTETHYSLTAQTEDNRVTLDGSMTVDEDVVGQTLESLQNIETTDTEVTEVISAMEEAGLKTARADASLTDDQFRFDTGAAFEDLAALRDAVQSTGPVPGTFASAVGRTEGDTFKSYVRLTGAVDADASEDEVRDLSVVDDETTVHMPGEGDRDFPSMDTERAREYLGVGPVETNTSGKGTEEDSGVLGPGFGVGAALIALAGGSLFLARRRRR